MEIRVSKKYCILTPLNSKINARETLRLMEEAANNQTLKIGIDLSCVEDCTIDFIEALKTMQVGLFNISSDIFSILNIMNLDKFVSLYATEEDFKLDRNRLLNRKFTLV